MNFLNFNWNKSHAFPVADPETSERGGARNMKYKPPHAAAIYFMTIFYRQRGAAMAPLPPPPLDLLLLLHWPCMNTAHDRSPLVSL